MTWRLFNFSYCHTLVALHIMIKKPKKIYTHISEYVYKDYKRIDTYSKM